MTSPDHRMLALASANRKRVADAHTCQLIRSSGRRSGALQAADIIRNRSSSMRFIKLLRAIPRIGDRYSRIMLDRAHIDPDTKVNSDAVTDRQRQRLIGDLVAHATGTNGL